MTSALRGPPPVAGSLAQAVPHLGPLPAAGLQAQAVPHLGPPPAAGLQAQVVSHRGLQAIGLVLQAHHQVALLPPLRVVAHRPSQEVSHFPVHFPGHLHQKHLLKRLRLDSQVPASRVHQEDREVPSYLSPVQCQSRLPKEHLELFPTSHLRTISMRQLDL